MQRQRQFEGEVLRRRRAEEAAARDEEAQMQGVLLGIEEQRRKDRQMELELLFREQELRERTAFQRAARKAEERVVNEERSRFNELRGELRRRQGEAEAQQVQQHERAMAQLIVERERQLWQDTEAARRDVQARV